MLLDRFNIRFNEEVRERVQKYNQGIRKIRKKELASNDVEVLGDISSALGALDGGLQGGGIKASASVINKLKSPLAAIYDLVVEDTSLANVSDRLRGIVNRVPSESIRIYRIQSQLRRKRR
ncbi:MAG: hypothetical protein OXE99_15195 [Cellvibrionales bacterium]|nr:hypothetical protein [Cellvibrionales bacterium]